MGTSARAATSSHVNDSNPTSTSNSRDALSNASNLRRLRFLGGTLPRHQFLGVALDLQRGVHPARGTAAGSGLHEHRLSVFSFGFDEVPASGVSSGTAYRAVRLRYSVVAAAYPTAAIATHHPTASHALLPTGVCINSPRTVSMIGVTG